jgi:hypothetical protein
VNHIHFSNASIIKSQINHVDLGYLMSPATLHLVTDFLQVIMTIIPIMHLISKSLKAIYSFTVDIQLLNPKFIS